MDSRIKIALKFYDLKAEYLTPAVFVLILAVGFSSAFIPETLFSNVFFLIAYNVLTALLILFASTVYLYACICEFGGREHGGAGIREYIVRTLKSYHKLLLAYIIVLTACFAGFMLFFIPGLIVYTMLLFTSSFIVDKDAGIFKSMSMSYHATYGKKMEIFFILLLLNLIVLIPGIILILVIVPSGNVMMLTFVISFFVAVTNLVQQRITALLYIEFANRRL